MVVSQFLVYSEGKGRGGDILGGRGEEIYWEGGSERGGYLQDTFN